MREPYVALIWDFGTVGVLCLLVSFLARKSAIHVILVALSFWSLAFVALTYGFMMPKQMVAAAVVFFICGLMGWAYYDEHQEDRRLGKNPSSANLWQRLREGWQERVRDFHRLIGSGPNRPSHW